ncbi:MAG: carboxypeptidase regulatory-like domain-containing protein [Acidobacteriia bacterium]|nr:carboxypeptidase regulatory-like domain-containing protein [Terriglobia bacterium]
MHFSKRVLAGVLVCVVALVFAGTAAAQRNTADLSGTISDPQGLAVKSAKVTLTSLSTGAERTAVADENGRYSLVGLPPGKYKLSVDGGANFAAFENPGLVLTVGEAATFDLQLQLRGVQQTVTVTTETAPIETTKTEISQTVEQRRIDNLPINGRSYINFTLTSSQTSRDVAPSIGPAPTSGLNVGGQRGRSNQVNVDGADAVDNSINGIRATVSQEAVQEFQLILSNYNAEYGRATGGVVNIVTKSGGNDVHGNLFGYVRNKSFQARNAFSGQVDPVSGNLMPVKQAYTRVQAGATLGGPIKKDKSFYFFSYEYTQREETGFSSIGKNNFDMQSYNFPFFPAPLWLMPAQASAVNQLLLTGVPALQSLGAQYAVLMGSASSVALNKFDYGAVAPALTSGFVNPGPGAQFPLPVTCPALQTVNGVNCSAIGYGAAPLPTSYVGLMSLRGNFPVMEKTSLWSGRLDQRWNNHNTSFLRVGVSPSLVTGIQTTSQNQVFGQNSGSRTGMNQSRDVSGTFQHDTIIGERTFNQFRFQFARRGLHYGYSKLPGGDQLGVNIPGYAYFGREPYATVDRIERRWEWTDNITFVRGSHTVKMGGDVNIVQLRTSKPTIFQLDFGGVANFGGLSASTFGMPNCVLGSGPACTGGIALPGTSAVQSYGLGIPTTYIQGIGGANRPFNNIPLAFFVQDSWRVNRKLTFNYGVRYDVEFTPLFPAATAVNQAAERVLGIVEGIPRDKNNLASRFGLAWDPKGDGKTVIRAGYGIFYDHPLLAVAFDALTVDGGQSVQLISAGGAASACGVIPVGPPGYPMCGGGLDSPANLNGSSIFQGVLNSLPSMYYQPNQQRFDPFGANSLFANQNYLTAGFPLPILPFTLPVSRDFKYGYAQQTNLTIEREIAGSWKISAGYQYTHGLRLNRPVDINATDPRLLTQNLFNADAAGLGFSSPVTVVAPAATVMPTASTCGVGVIAPQVLGALFGCPAPLAALNGQFVGTPAFFNFFRPSGPNPSFAGLAGGYANQVALAGFAGYPVGFGAPVPFNSVDAQMSNGNSVYHGLTVNVTKRFSKGFEVLSSYTWSHTIDDSIDLQSPLEPQDSRFPNQERGNSNLDQRHRWVTSAVYQSPSAKSGDSFWKHFLGDFSLAPIVEFASGRPYTVITGVDYRLDLGASNGRPSVGSGAVTTTSPFIPGAIFTLPNSCLTRSGASFSVPGVTTLGYGCNGNLSRNAFVAPNFFQWDLRVSKRVPFGERFKLDLIADAFNLANRTNVAAVNQLCNPAAGATCTAGAPTAASDARQFQFALKLNW